jgi:hypothetical protein
MASKIDVINRALRAIAEQPIQSLTEGSEPAAIISDIYDIELEAEIREWPFTWAQRTAELALISSETPPDYGYAYQLPADYLMIMEIIDLTTSATIYSWDNVYSWTNVRFQEWEVREGKLYINSSNVQIKYTVLEVDATKWDATFTRAFAYRLAMTAGPSITEKMALIERAERQYITEINKARANSASESRKQSRLSEDYLNARNV